MSSYRELLQAAIARTSERGYAFEPFQEVETKTVISESQGFQLLKLLHQEFGDAAGLPQHLIAFRCGQISKAMKSHVERVTGQQCLLTIGTVTKGGSALWAVHENSLMDMGSTGKYHVWLTMPWLEIIDFTLQYSLFVQKGLNPDDATPIAGDPDLIRPYAWVPLVVGDKAAAELLSL